MSKESVRLVSFEKFDENNFVKLKDVMDSNNAYYYLVPTSIYSKGESKAKIAIKRILNNEERIKSGREILYLHRLGFKYYPVAENYKVFSVKSFIEGKALSKTEKFELIKYLRGM